jgi:hypothetical protein
MAFGAAVIETLRGRFKLRAILRDDGQVEARTIPCPILEML